MKEPEKNKVNTSPESNLFERQRRAAGGVSKADKIHTWIAASVSVALLLSYIFYKCFAHSLIGAMYHGRSLEVLNNLIKYQHKYSLDHYLNSGDLLFGRLVYLAVIFSVLLLLASYILNRLFFSEKKIRFVYVLAFCLLVQMLVSILNPIWRTYYNHGFLRGCISYQIQNGGVPPQNPLFAGHMLYSPWGFAWLGAQVSTLLNITPFHAFNLINSINICLIALLAYKISGQFFKDRKANICSVLFSIFGVTIFPRHLLQWMESFLYSARTEWRATPFFHKFTTGCGDPTGMLFFLLFVFAAIGIIKNRNIWLYTFALILAIVSGGFLYAPMLPGVIGSIFLICIANSLFAWKGYFQRSLRPVIHLIAALAVSIILLLPYFRSVSSGVDSHAALFHLEYLWPHLVSFLLPLTPIFILIAISRNSWLKKGDMQVLLLLIMVVIANTGLYIFVHVHTFSEYKFLMIAALFIGLIAGVAFNELRKKLPRFVTLILLFIFLLPSVDQVIDKINRHSNKVITNVLFSKGFLEKGTDLYVTDQEENEMYEWIKQNTDEDRIFLDSTMKLPIYAKRRLLIGPTEGAFAGYCVSMDFIKERNGYDDNEYNKRKAIEQNIYGLDDSLESSYVGDYLRKNNILVIVRTEDLSNKFEFPGLQELFRSSKGRFQIMECSN